MKTTYRLPLLLAAAGISGLITGCASQPKDIAATSVSTIQYENYSCKQVGMEMNRVSGRADDLYASLKQRADNDAMQMGVGLILFWPTLFLLEGGDGPEAAEYARLKGERTALDQVAVAKECDTAALPKWVTPEERAKQMQAMQERSEQEG
jgi:hypothetical protein